MTFLQPIVLWGLPLVLLPILIHLINRLRHRPQQWAAMRFLVSATRSSVSHAKLKQFLILLFRVLAVVALILFLSRPLAGGWLGWTFSAAPDAILILLDRSPSMEIQVAGSTNTWREQAIKLLSRAAADFDRASHLVLIESGLRTPQEIANAASLAQFSQTAPTDTAADIPAMMQAAVKWLIDNKAGTAEIWIASDLQRSNWQLNDARWKNTLAQLTALPQQVRVKLLSSPPGQPPNTSVSLEAATRRQRAGQAELQFISNFQRTGTGADTLPVNIVLDGTRSQADVVMDGSALRWRHKMEIGNQKTGGWGWLELPADANRNDNTNYFVYGPETALRSSIISSDRKQTPYLQFSAATVNNNARQVPRIINAAEFESGDWQDNTLLIWQEPLPSGPTADKIRAFVEEGGIVLFLPPGKTDAQQFLGASWGEIQSTEAGKNFRVGRWDEDQGPLAKTDEGLSLPVSQLAFQRRQTVLGQKTILASFDDGVPFLTRETLGRGEFLFCASLPSREWSSLGDGRVLVPMIQRLLQFGSRRLQQTGSMECGKLTAADQELRWTCLDSTVPKDIRLHAGVYRSGERLLAINRPKIEDDPETAPMEEAHALFGALPFRTFQDNQNSTDQMQGEFWRVFLFGMMIFLLVESILVMPPCSAPAKGTVSAGPGARRPGTVQVEETVS